jgi:hypothetical protein
VNLLGFSNPPEGESPTQSFKMLFNWMESLKNPIKVLKTVHLWSDENSSKHRLVFILILRMFFLEIGFILLVIFLLNVESIEEFSKSVFVTTELFGLIFKSTNFAVNKRKIKSLHESLETLVEQNSWIQNSEKMKERIKQIDMIFALLIIFAISSVLMGLFPVALVQELPLKMWFPFDYTSSKTLLWLTAAYQTFGGLFLGPTIVVFDLLPLYLLSYLTGIVEELCEKLKNVCQVKIIESNENAAMSLKTVESLERSERNKNLVRCVEIHQRVIEMAKEINEIFGKDFWLQGMSGIFILCTTSFSLTVVSLPVKVRASLK